MLKCAGSYPLLSLPVCVGCISLVLVYLDNTPSDVMWGVGGGTISIVANIANWAGCLVAERLGDPAGRVAAATAEVCAVILGIIVIVIFFGLITNQLIAHLYTIFVEVPLGGHPSRRLRCQQDLHS